MGILRALTGISSAVMITSLVILLYVGAALTLITDSDFYLLEFDKLGVYNNFEDKAEPVRLANGLTSYFRDGSAQQPEIWGFNLSEILHLRDVKMVVLDLRYAFYFCGFMLFASILAAIAFFKGNLSRNLPRLLIYSGVLVLGLGLVFILMAAFFSQSFVIFHKVFFPQGNWQFSFDSTLIRLFPEQFFRDAFLAIILRVVFFGLLLGALGFILGRTRRNQKEL